MLAASDARLAAAIRNGLDLDSGLAQIIGEPSRREAFAPGAALGVRGLGRAPGVPGEWPLVPDASEVTCRIAVLRFEILDVLRDGAHIPLCGTAAALCSGAAANLKDLNRGLEAHELTRPDAISLLDLADLALEKALDTQKFARRHPGRTWAEGNPWAAGEQGPRAVGGAHLNWMIAAPTWPAWLVIAVPALVASLTAAAVPLWAGRALPVGPVAAAVGIPVVSGLVFLITLVAVPVTTARTLRRRAAARRAGQALPGARIRQSRDPAATIAALRGRLTAARCGVMRLFDEADGQRPRCAPR